MDDWENVVQWTKQKRQEEKRKEWEHFKRTCRNWPVISIITVAFGGLAFLMLDPMRGIVCTIIAFIASVVFVEHFS
jgi:hypothetical protein